MTKIGVNCQSSIRIEGNKVIYFDPYKIEEESHDADFIFLTHNHYDHFDVVSIKKLRNEKTIIIMPDTMAVEVLTNFGNRNVYGVKPNENYDIEGLEFMTVPSYNVNKDFHKKEAEWVGYIVELDDKKYYVAGDTDVNEDIKQISCDVAFVPIGGIYTMNVEEAADFINEIKPKVVIPTHYAFIEGVGTLEDGEKFKKLIGETIECELLIK